MARVRNIDADSDEEVDTEEEEDNEDVNTQDCSALIDRHAVTRRVKTRKSPHLSCLYRQLPVQVCLDTGAEINLMSNTFAAYVRIRMSKATQGALQADQNTSLDVVGEVKNIKLQFGRHSFVFDGLVTSKDIGDIIAGEPFLEDNDIAVRPFKKEIIIKGRDVVPYNNL